MVMSSRGGGRNRIKDAQVPDGRQLGSNVLVSDWPVIYQTEDFVPNSSTLRDKAGAILSWVLWDGADCLPPGLNSPRPSSCKDRGRLSLWRHANCFRGGGWRRWPAPSCRRLASSGDGRRRGGPWVCRRVPPPSI